MRQGASHIRASSYSSQYPVVSAYLALTSPLTLMMYKLDVRLHTSSLSLLRGRNTTLLHAVSVTKFACGGVKVRKQSVERTSQICNASTGSQIKG